MSGSGGLRLGLDIGGSKIAGLALDGAGRELARRRRPMPRDYGAMLAAIADCVAGLERAGGRGRAPRVGVSLPGVLAPDGGSVHCVNLPWLDHRPFAADLAAALDRPVRLANDANCFVLSEATDGAAAGADVVFGAILGTGVGGGIVVGGRVLAGRNALAGEWGQNPMPWFGGRDAPWDGSDGDDRTERWLGGAALARDYAGTTGEAIEALEVARRAEAGDDPAARAALARYERRLAQALAAVINLLDPDVIVLGGGLSQIRRLYAAVPRLWAAYTVAAEPRTGLVAAAYGPESGLRGAARL
ncbi:MAG TPA: ROK family protein [Geminicoccaceae bacterium]|nr:ROK family protein [Geminicoccaceae bacterium]